MPRQDGTGPKGLGPNTGRGLGRCKDMNIAADASYGRGCGYRYQGGRSEMTNNNLDESRKLQNYIKELEKELAETKEELKVAQEKENNK